MFEALLKVRNHALNESRHGLRCCSNKATRFEETVVCSTGCSFEQEVARPSRSGQKLLFVCCRLLVRAASLDAVF